MRENLIKYESIHTTEEFIKEALALNALLSKQQDLFVLQMSNIVPHLEINEQLTNTVIDQRIEFNELDTKISDYIEWQDSEEGRRSNLPKIKETYKDSIFTYWDIQVKQVELAIARAAGISKSIVKTINHMLHTSSLIKEGDPKSIPDLKILEQSWKNIGQIREETTLYIVYS